MFLDRAPRGVMLTGVGWAVIIVTTLLAWGLQMCRLLSSYWQYDSQQHA